MRNEPVLETLPVVHQIRSSVAAPRVSRDRSLDHVACQSPNMAAEIKQYSIGIRFMEVVQTHTYK